MVHWVVRVLARTIEVTALVMLLLGLFNHLYQVTFGGPAMQNFETEAGTIVYLAIFPLFAFTAACCHYIAKE